MRKHNLRAALLAGLSLTALATVQPASARNDFWQPFRETSFRDTPLNASADRAEPKKKSRKKTDTAGETKAAERAAAIPSGPLHIIVSIHKQRVTLFADGKPFANAPVSTGTPGHPTPTGIFSVIQKNKHHVSNLYDAAMPYMQRITWSGVAMHTGPLPGYAASHGCVRLPNEFAQMLWKATKIGARVIIAKPEVAVAEIEHLVLFSRRMKLARSASLSVAEVQQAMAQASPNQVTPQQISLQQASSQQALPHITPKIPVAELPVPRPVTPVRLADGAKLVPGAVIGDSVQPVGSVGMVHRPDDEAAKLAATADSKIEEPAVELAAAPEAATIVEAKPVAEAKPAEPIVVVAPVKPAEPVQIVEPVQVVEPVEAASRSRSRPASRSSRTSWDRRSPRSRKLQKRPRRPQSLP